MKTIAILNGEKMILPFYGKYGGMYGMFTTEGFVVADPDEPQRVEIKTLEYDYLFHPPKIFTDKSFQEIYNNLANPEFR